jgi:bacteriorhodopsin
MNNVQVSAFISICLQFITGLFEANGLFFNVRPEDKIVKDILFMELTVQAIEFIFYLYLVYIILYGEIHSKITSHRYLDWFITTPTMLISFVLFFKYLQNPARNIRWFESFKEELGTILKIVIANALMLLFGFLAERNYIDTYLGVTIGFIPFAYAFKILYSNYAKFTNLSLILYYFSFIVWSMYGVGAVLPFNIKNTMYNILDLFSKNTYGLFLYFYLWSIKV